MGLFRRKEQRAEIQPRSDRVPKVRRLDYFTAKTQGDEGIRRIVSYDKFCEALSTLSLFKSGDAYVLPGAQTTVTPSQSENAISLTVKTIKPERFHDLEHPYNMGLEKELTELIDKFGLKGYEQP